MPYIQVGIIAERDKNGNFLPPQPIYIHKSDGTDAKSEEAQEQVQDCDEFATRMAAKFKQYQNEMRRERKRIEKERKARRAALYADKQEGEQ